MYLIEKPDAETIVASLKEVLMRCKLKLSDWCWQAYDGAATMSGVAVRVQDENTAAHRIHCANHIRFGFERMRKPNQGYQWCLELCARFGSFYSPLSIENVHVRKYCQRWQVEPDKFVKSLHLLCPLVGLLEQNRSQQCWTITRPYMIRCWLFQKMALLVKTATKLQAFQRRWRSLSPFLHCILQWTFSVQLQFKPKASLRRL